MNLNIKMESINGTYDPVYSKSTTHRALFAALLCEGITTVHNVTYCDDVLATLNVLHGCGCKVEVLENKITVDSTKLTKPSTNINCNESASTLRMAIVICSYLFSEVSFIVSDSLIKRPIDGFKDLVNITKTANVIKCKYNYDITEIFIAGDISSQYITGLMLVAPRANIATINITTKIVSLGYLNLTKDVLKTFGVSCFIKGNKITISGKYYNDNIYVNEIDESSLSFFTVLEELGAHIIPSSTNEKTSQPDAILTTIIEKNYDEIDIDNYPDLLPIVTLYCCFKNTKTKITNTYRTTIKESNRLVNTMEQLNKLGANIKLCDGELLIAPVTTFKSGVIVSSCFDHRIEMMLAIAAYKAKEITITDAGNNNKSFPEFYEILLQLGAIVQQV